MNADLGREREAIGAALAAAPRRSRHAADPEAGFHTKLAINLAPGLVRTHDRQPGIQMVVR
jgi:hypothetical protein